ncbi:MAG: flagellar FlbD family protein [bacterium]
MPASKWDIKKRIHERVSAYNAGTEKEIKTKTGPMITLHKLNKEEITINTGQIQSIEKMGENSLIVYSTGNRIVVVESSEVIRKLIEESK